MVCTPVQVKMATSENCRSLCGVVHLTEAQTRLFRERIEQEYHVHLYVQYTCLLHTLVCCVLYTCTLSTPVRCVHLYVEYTCTLSTPVR